MFGNRTAFMAGSPAKTEKAVATVTEDKDEMTYLAFGRMAKNLHSEDELVKNLLHLRENDILAEVRKLEGKNKHFDGFSELYQMPPCGFRTQWNSSSHSIIYVGHSYLSSRLTRLNDIKDTAKAILVVGSDAAKAEDFRTHGYPTQNQFSTAFDSVYLFLPRDDYKVMGLPLWDNSETFVYYLKSLSGAFGYKNRIVVILDSKETILNNFTESLKDGKRQVRHYFRSDTLYKAVPEKVLAVLEPPLENELGLLDAFVVAYGGKLLRSGYFLGTHGKALDHNMWSGDGMGRLLDAAYGLKREWRPFLTHKNRQSDSSLPDVNLRSVEDAARALHVVNCLTEVFKKYELI